MNPYVMVFITALCIGYFMGRYVGQIEGMKIGRARAPLELRIVALQKGICPLCNQLSLTTEYEDSDT